MPSPVLHQGATVICAHGGQAMPTVPSTRLMVSGMAATATSAPWTVAGCAFAPPTGNGPCVTAQWLVGASRATSEGQPLVIMTGTSICTPTGTPLTAVNAQTRVLAT
jgi:hypothetical protein